MTNDAGLLELEAETLWTMNSLGRLVSLRRPDRGVAPHLVIAVTSDGASRKWLGQAVPDATARHVASIVDASRPTPPAEQPAGLAECCELLEAAVGRVAVASGPSYLVPPDVTYPVTTPPILSDTRPPAELPPAPGWEPDEWDLLLAGQLRGPWAMAAADGQVISLCHSARLTEAAAEAGVWTDPRHRGHGHAAATTAAWASQLTPTGRHLFYSTSADNRSSQQVAARLGLRSIGWTWQVISQPDQ